MSDTSLSTLIWGVAELLRGDYRPAEYSKVILPFTVLRRLDCVLAPTKSAVLAEKAAREAKDLKPDSFLQQITKLPLWNTSPLDLKTLLGDQDNLAVNLAAYVQGFSSHGRDIFDSYRFSEQVDRLRKAGLLYQVIERFVAFDLSPEAVPAHQMGLVFEELIRKFSDAANDTAGEQFTPRDGVGLMVSILFAEDHDVLTPGANIVRTIYDPTAGTGGLLSGADEYLRAFNPAATLTMFGQELNGESYAICKADMLIKGQDVRNIVLGNTLSNDGHADKKFDYMLANPPFGVDWKKIEKTIREEHERGTEGRFAPGLPRVSDGSMLFLMHLLSKMQSPEKGNSRIGIVLNGSPLFTGGAGSGESEIRRYLLENDLVEAIIGLPTDMFFNTGISTYLWFIHNKKPAERKGFVQLIDASSQCQKMQRSQGSKRKEMSEQHIELVTKLFKDAVDASIATITAADGTEKTVVIQNGEAPPRVPDGGRIKMTPISKVFRNEEFGYRTIVVERPMLDENGKPIIATKGKGKGKPMPDPARRDSEDVPLSEDIHTYFAREVLPHAPDAWIDEERTKIGYEIPFNKVFYVFEPPRPLEAIDADLKRTTDRIMALLGRMAA